MAKVGVDMPVIRSDYEAAVQQLIAEVERKKAANMPAEDLAKWVVRERTAIARRMRMRSGPGTLVTFEIRDNIKYGLGGRTYKNMYRRAYARGLRGDDIQRQLIKGATHPNSEISAAAIKGARYLKYGGRVVLVISVVTTAYRILTAPEDELEKVLYEEAGGIIGGSAGSGMAVGLCLLFGVVSGGWGLLACGVVGGIAGGVGGTILADHIYYSQDDAIEQAENEGIIDASLLSEEPVLVCQ
jgi:hypothetical protein